MPAETHQQRDPVTVESVLELIWLVAGPGEVQEPDRTLALDAVDLRDELALSSVWAVVAEEFADRTVGEPDLSALLAARTFGELAGALVASLGGPVGPVPSPGPPTHRPGAA